MKKPKYELGYTPHNLKTLLKEHDKTAAGAGELLTVTARAVQRWLAELDIATHRDMPHKKWLELIEKLQHIEN